MLPTATPQTNASSRTVPRPSSDNVEHHPVHGSARDVDDLAGVVDVGLGAGSGLEVDGEHRRPRVEGAVEVLEAGRALAVRRVRLGQRPLGAVPAAGGPRGVLPPAGAPRPVRRRAATRWGLDPVQVLQAVSTAYQGDQVGKVFQGNRVFNVAVWLAPKERDSVADIASLPLRTPDCNYVRLGHVARR